MVVHACMCIVLMTQSLNAHISDAVSMQKALHQHVLSESEVWGNETSYFFLQAVFGGMGQRDPARFVKATGHPDVYFVEDKTLTIKEVSPGFKQGTFQKYGSAQSEQTAARFGDTAEIQEKNALHSCPDPPDWSDWAREWIW